MLDIWCALPFDRLVLRALSPEVAPPREALKCAPGWSDVLLVDCLPGGGGQLHERLRQALGYVPQRAVVRQRKREPAAGSWSGADDRGSRAALFRLLRASRVRLRGEWRRLLLGWPGRPLHRMGARGASIDCRRRRSCGRRRRVYRHQLAAPTPDRVAVARAVRRCLSSVARATAVTAPVPLEAI